MGNARLCGEMGVAGVHGRDRASARQTVRERWHCRWTTVELMRRAIWERHDHSTPAFVHCSDSIRNTARYCQLPVSLQCDIPRSSHHIVVVDWCKLPLRERVAHRGHTSHRIQRLMNSRCPCSRKSVCDCLSACSFETRTVSLHHAVAQCRERFSSTSAVTFRPQHCDCHRPTHCPLPDSGHEIADYCKSALPLRCQPSSQGRPDP